MNRTTRILGAALLMGAAAGAALAGGPNYMFDAANKIPYVWKMENWPNGQVPVYVDSGNLKNSNPLINNAVATSWVVAAFDQWNNVPTSTFRAQVVGHIATDVTIANVSQIYPAYNGGGIWVVFDQTGLIFRNYLGLSSSVLGYTPTDFYAAGSNEILEVTALFNGPTIRSYDTTGAYFSGVFTHEFGHAINLRHSQGNGAVWNKSASAIDAPFPYGCTNQPYAGGPGVGPAGNQLETMYPFLDMNVGGTSQGQFTVDIMDDIQAISDLYPGPGWPDNYGTVSGTIRYLTKILGNGTGPTQEISGVNLIARNLANPYGDFVTTTSGELTRGATVDGTYVLHGLTPGATYGIYTDRFLAGSFPTAPLAVLPGPEEWWNGVNESGDGTRDDRCAWTGITAAAATTTTADITFNKVKDAPSMTIMDFTGNANRVSADGSTMVGADPALDGYWMWSTTGGYKQIGGFAPVGGTPGISDDGSKIAGTIKDTDGVVKWGLYDVASQTWTILPPPATTPQSPTCTTPLQTTTVPAYGTVWGISGDGLTVYGTTYNDRSPSGACRKARASYWTAATGPVILPKASPDTVNIDSRAEAGSYDGSVLSGYDNTNSKVGSYWINGVEYFTQGAPNSTPSTFYGETYYVTRDASTILGGTSQGAPTSGAYRHTNSDASNEILFTPTDPNVLLAAAQCTDNAQDVISGYEKDGSGGNSARIWTPQLGWGDLVQFLEAQGLWVGVPVQDQLVGVVQSMSADGTVWVGQVRRAGGVFPYRIEIPKAIVCHKSPGNPNAKVKDLGVTFPGGLADHLAHGDTLGLCSNGD